MNREVFFAEIRKGFGTRLTQVQVYVAEAILDRARALSTEHLAYILATAWGEAKLTPKRENMNYSAKRIRQVWPSRPEAVAFAGKPEALANSVYGGRLGNRPGTDDGWRFRGGGVDQLTGRDHYELVGIAAAPEKILEPDFAAWSIVHGMTTGRYTGKKLSDYGDGAKFNARAARAIVNGDGRLNGETYAGHWRVFRDALTAAGWKPSAAKPKALSGLKAGQPLSDAGGATGPAVPTPQPGEVPASSAPVKPSASLAAAIIAAGAAAWAWGADLVAWLNPFN